MTSRIIRTLVLLADRPHSQQELAREFGVDAVTIRRIIRELSLHYPITDEKDGREVVYRFTDGYRFIAPNLTASELSALLLAQNTITAIGSGSFGMPFADSSRTLIEKVRAALPQRLRDYLHTLSDIFGTSAMSAKDFSSHAETIDVLTTAAMARRRVRMRYHNLHDDKVKDREFHPYAVYFDPDGATLKTIGLDPGDQRIKPFSIDRIKSIKETGAQFERLPEFTLRGYLTEFCFNGIHGDPILVRLRAHATTARIFAERNFHPTQRTIEPLHRSPDGTESITIEMRVARGRGLERFILGWLPDLEVLEPPELREKIADILHRSLKPSTGAD